MQTHHSREELVVDLVLNKQPSSSNAVLSLVEEYGAKSLCKVDKICIWKPKYSFGKEWKLF